MINKKPKNIIILVIDSLRYNSLYQDEGGGLEYVNNHASSFHQVSSAGCWTLPATASIFSGMLPSEHRATSQTRKFDLSGRKLSLAQVMKTKGYETYQITSNVATSDVFGLDNGFDHVIKSWEINPQLQKNIIKLAVMIGKPRIRKQLISKNLINNSLSQDLAAGSVWVRSYADEVFDKAREILYHQPNKSHFLFLNLMEAHFPYHISSEFKTLSTGIIDKLKELYSLYHTVNQSFLTKDNSPPSQKMINLLAQRQKLAWKMIAKQIDDFVQELHENKDNLVIVMSDHGENFGDNDWLYHFSNVTDSCTRVPILWLEHGITPQSLHHPTSSRFLYDELCKRVGYTFNPEHSLFEQTTKTMPMSQSFWYNNNGKTLAKYRFNQFCFEYEGNRYLRKLDQWYSMAATDYQKVEKEDKFKLMDSRIDPIQELVKERDSKIYLEEKLNGFYDFEKKYVKLDK